MTYNKYIYLFHEAIGASFVGGQSQSFNADGRDYAVLWDEPVTQSDAMTKCQDIGGTLAQIFGESTRLSIK